jgi:hypothetical protein
MAQLPNSEKLVTTLFRTKNPIKKPMSNMWDKNNKLNSRIINNSSNQDHLFFIDVYGKVDSGTANIIQG